MKKGRVCRKYEDTRQDILEDCEKLQENNRHSWILDGGYQNSILYNPSHCD